MALKQRHRADELVTNDTTLVRNCNSNKENHKYNSRKYQQPSVTLPPLQYAKWTLLKFKWGTWVPLSLLRGPHLTLNLLRLKRSVVETKTFTAPLESVGFNIVYLKLELKVLTKLGVIKSPSASFLIVSADTYLVQLNHYPGVYIHLL